MAYRGIDYLRTKLELKKTRVDLRYIFYEQKQRALDLEFLLQKDLNISIQ